MSKDAMFLCNGAANPKSKKHSDRTITSLDYRPGTSPNQRVKINIPGIRNRLVHVPARVLDLLEIASYVYVADRLVRRGARDQIDFSGWSRRFHFVIRVSDEPFWSEVETKQALGALLRFIAGDAEYEFTFQGGFTRDTNSLFDGPDHGLQQTDAEVMLFSGGIDSLTGAVDLLVNQTKPVCLVSHKSGSTATSRTRNCLVAALRKRFPNRIEEVAFQSTLHGLGQRPPEETQRTRFFLYSSIALAVSQAFQQSHMHVFENGVTSMHLRKRQDLVNARATRTTHPKTMRLLKSLFERVLGHHFDLKTPFDLKTKTDVLLTLKELGHGELLSSTVSCAKTIKLSAGHTHCGECSQCVDRRFAAYAAGLGDQDDVGIYMLDIANADLGPMTDARTVVNDFLFQATEFQQANESHFEEGRRLTEVTELADGLIEFDQQEFISSIHTLCKRHGEQVWAGYEQMRAANGLPSKPRSENSLYSMVEGGEPHKEPHFLLAERLQRTLTDGISLAYQRKKPENENELNDQIEALLKTTMAENVEREFPLISFATKKSIPDHSVQNSRVLVEGKYPRGKTRPLNTIKGEMEKDLIDFNIPAAILFLVYDPERLIKQDTEFRTSFEALGRCRVCIVR